jgi:hypothetical protein
MLFAGWLALGCSNVPLVPFSSQDVTVTQAIERGPYIDTRLQGSGFDLRFLFPASKECREALRPESRVRYAAEGPFGQVEPAEGDACVPLGIADLDTWRDRKPRPDARLAPSAQAKYRELRRDSEVILLQGSFPLANRVGMAGAMDLVAMLPNTPECEKVVQRGVATMIYRDVGRDVFRLLIDPGQCPVLGFAQPTFEMSIRGGKKK